VPGQGIQISLDDDAGRFFVHRWRPWLALRALASAAEPFRWLRPF
jgi:hypothetical protein